MSHLITMEHVRTAADRIVKINRGCYRKSRLQNDYDQCNNHRTTCMDMLEGLKSVMIAAHLHDTKTYEHLTELWDEVLNWP